MSLLADLDDDLARDSLAEFTRQAWSIIEPATPLVDNWHIDAVCEHLEAITWGQIRKLVINIPPGHMKSTLAAVCWPAWTWIHKPGWRGLFASYALPYSLRDSVKTRLLVESDWFRERFSGPAGWRIADDQNTKGKFENTERGFREVVTMGGGTGARGNSVLVDDPLSAKQAMSKLDREAAIDWWDRTMSTRLNDMATGAHVIVQQRLHRQDLAGHVLARGGYEHLCLPAEFNSAKRSRTYVDNRLFFQDPRTEDNELLFPEKFPREVIDDLKVVLGSDGAAGQLAQEPVAEGGSMFKRWWWRFWKSTNLGPPIIRPRESSPAPAVMLPTRFDEICLSVDCNFGDRKKKDVNSRASLQVWGKVGANFYLLDKDTRIMTFTEMIKAIRAMVSRWPRIGRKYVENKAAGPPIVDSLNDEIGGFISVNPDGSKEARAAAVTPWVEAGNVFLPEDAPWLGEYVDELADFPKGQHDDDVDATSQALNAMREPDAVTRLRMLTTH